MLGRHGQNHARAAIAHRFDPDRMYLLLSADPARDAPEAHPGGGQSIIPPPLLEQPPQTVWVEGEGMTASAHWSNRAM
jgi:hypothetical protein